MSTDPPSRNISGFSDSEYENEEYSEAIKAVPVNTKAIQNLEELNKEAQHFLQNAEIKPLIDNLLTAFNLLNTNRIVKDLLYINLEAICLYYKGEINKLTDSIRGLSLNPKQGFLSKMLKSTEKQETAYNKDLQQYTSFIENKCRSLEEPVPMEKPEILDQAKQLTAHIDALKKAVMRIELRCGYNNSNAIKTNKTSFPELYKICEQLLKTSLFKDLQQILNEHHFDSNSITKLKNNTKIYEAIQSLQPYLIKLHFIGLQFNQIYRQKTIDRVEVDLLLRERKDFLDIEQRHQQQSDALLHARLNALKRGGRRTRKRRKSRKTRKYNKKQRITTSRKFPKRSKKR